MKPDPVVSNNEDELVIIASPAATATVAHHAGRGTAAATAPAPPTIFVTLGNIDPHRAIFDHSSIELQCILEIKICV